MKHIAIFICILAAAMTILTATAHAQNTFTETITSPNYTPANKYVKVYLTVSNDKIKVTSDLFRREIQRLPRQGTLSVSYQLQGSALQAITSRLSQQLSELQGRLNRAKQNLQLCQSRR